MTEKIETTLSFLSLYYRCALVIVSTQYRYYRLDFMTTVNDNIAYSHSLLITVSYRLNPNYNSDKNDKNDKIIPVAEKKENEPKI